MDFFFPTGLSRKKFYGKGEGAGEKFQAGVVRRIQFFAEGVVKVILFYLLIFWYRAFT